MASGRASVPQSWNRYSYVLNNPSKLIDLNGLEENDPQELEKKKDFDTAPQEQPKLSQPPLPKVTVTAANPQPRMNVELPDGNYATGMMSVLTITITDQSGKPLEGLTVAESNKVIEQEPALPFAENQKTVTTDANGSFPDLVGGGAQITSEKVSRAEATEIIHKQVESRVKVVTEQTLTISAPGQGVVATAVYQRTFTNLNERGSRNPAFNSSGRHVNNFSVSMTPVTVSRPKSP